MPVAQNGSGFILRFLIVVGSIVADIENFSNILVDTQCVLYLVDLAEVLDKPCW